MNQTANKPTELITPPQRNKPTQPPVLRQRYAAQALPLSKTRSQIPVRTEQIPASSLEQHMRNLQPFTISHKLNPAHYAIANALTERHTVVESVEAAFTVYGERLQSDLRDFRSLCATLVMKEQNEKEQWHTLCLKIMRERDIARQHLLELQSATRRSSSPSDTNMNRPSKRVHDSEERTISPRSMSCESRPICSLRASPVHSPPGSPYQSSRPASLPPISVLPGSSSSSSSSAALTPPTSASSTSSEPAPKPERIEPPIKRRKSCEASAPASPRSRKPYSRSPLITDARATIPAMNPAEGGSLPFEFAHVDLMYVPVKNNFVCRACLLNSSKPTSQPTEPKSFPATASWDEMRDHCILSHPTACVDVARLHPSEIFELRRRLSLPLPSAALP